MKDNGPRKSASQTHPSKIPRLKRISFSIPYHFAFMVMASLKGRLLIYYWHCFYTHCIWGHGHGMVLWSRKRDKTKCTSGPDFGSKILCTYLFIFPFRDDLGFTFSSHFVCGVSRFLLLSRWLHLFLFAPLFSLKGQLALTQNKAVKIVNYLASLSGCQAVRQ